MLIRLSAWVGAAVAVQKILAIKFGISNLLQVVGIRLVLASKGSCALRVGMLLPSFF